MRGRYGEDISLFTRECREGENTQLSGFGTKLGGRAASALSVGSTTPAVLIKYI